MKAKTIFSIEEQRLLTRANDSERHGNLDDAERLYKQLADGLEARLGRRSAARGIAIFYLAELYESSGRHFDCNNCWKEIRIILQTYTSVLDTESL